MIALLDIEVAVLDDSRHPALRVKGTVCHEKLLDGLAVAGDMTVAGTQARDAKVTTLAVPFDLILNAA